MALLCSLSLFAVLVLVLAAIGLHLDARGDRRARRAWQHATDARLTGHDAQLTTLGRAVASLVAPAPAVPPSVVRPPHPAPIDPATMTESERTRGLTVAMMRPAAFPVRVVSVTRDDDPIHTRPTVEVPQATPNSDRESDDGITRVMRASERPTIEGMEVVPFPELIGSQDETPPRRVGLYSTAQPSNPPEADGPAPLTPTKLSRH